MLLGTILTDILTSSTGNTGINPTPINLPDEKADNFTPFAVGIGLLLLLVLVVIINKS